MPNPIWTPSAEKVEAANITAFQRMVAEQLAPRALHLHLVAARGIEGRVGDLHDLSHLSIRQLPTFGQRLPAQHDAPNNRVGAEDAVELRLANNRGRVQDLVDDDLNNSRVYVQALLQKIVRYVLILYII